MKNSSDTITKLDPIIQITIEYLTNSKLSLQKLGDELGVSRQAIWKKVEKGLNYFMAYNTTATPDPEFQIASLDKRVKKLEEKVKSLESLVVLLKRQLILSAAKIKFLQWFKDKVLEFSPKFKLGRLGTYQKKTLLDLCAKFKKNSGTIKEFCKAIGRSPETLLRWKKAYEANGINGLENKSMRPKNFGHKVPYWIKQQLVLLFLKFPYWTDYQYHKYIRFNPTTNWYVSLPTISKLKRAYSDKSQTEKERLKKRWCFAPGTEVWSVDFTTILKTNNYKLQLLTVSDARSRFSFESVLFLETSTEIVVDHLQELFIKYGKPKIIKADNGPEFRVDCLEKLRDLSVYLLNSPSYYGQFNGAHERWHRTLKKYISNFERHRNLTLLVEEINSFMEEYNYQMPHEYLEGKTPADVYFNDQEFVPKKTEVVKPYEKDGELRLKFTNRLGKPARLSMPLLET